jgi:phosphonate degradation associated HDIG domain protein
MSSTLTLDRIAELFSGHGAALYGGERISQTEHALQCAMLAEAAGESEAIVVAALLHDIGHLLISESKDDDMRHQEVAAQALAESLPEDVIEPIRLHVAAKRYLCSVDDNYWAGLSPASKESLELQGGPFDDRQAAQFARNPHAQTAVRVRQYDDQAKVVGLNTPPLRHYLEMVGRQLEVFAAS